MFAALKGKPLFYSFYFLVWIVVGKYFLLNLVLATLLSRSQDVVQKRVNTIQNRKMLDVDQLRCALLRRLGA